MVGIMIVVSSFISSVECTFNDYINFTNNPQRIDDNITPTRLTKAEIEYEAKLEAVIDSQYIVLRNCPGFSIAGDLHVQIRDDFRPVTGILGTISDSLGGQGWNFGIYAFPADQWHTVKYAYDFDAKTIVLYVDGEEKARDTFTATEKLYIHNGYIGGWNNSPRIFEGQLRYFKITEVSDPANPIIVTSLYAQCQGKEDPLNWVQVHENYWNTVGNPICVQCGPLCRECQSYTELNTCTSCIGANRTPSVCDCDDKFYDDLPTHKDCQPCLYKCGTCQNGTTCETCANSLRLKSKNDCECQDEYYSEPTDPICKACVHPCAKCQTATQCDECIVGANRNIAPDCKCRDRFYEEIGTLICRDCMVSCETCENNSSCMTCRAGSNRLGTGENCKCENGYYEDEGVCRQCPDKCKQCSDATTCTECDNSSRDLDLNCECKAGNYPNGSDLVCPQCVFPCKECSSQTVCSVCADGLGASHPTCLCTDGFFDNGIICQQCDHSQCATCENLANQCIQACTTGCKLCNSTNQCLEVEDGYFDDAGVIKRCREKCKKCSDFDTCTECANDTRDLGLNCECKLGNYQNNTDLICPVCEYPCQECSSLSVCSKCSDEVNATAPNCDCNDGYYDNGSSCGQCDHTKCATCEFSATNCLQSCSEGCKICTKDQLCLQIEDGYFDEGGIVKKCNSRLCVTCTGSENSCDISCDSSCLLCNGEGLCDACQIGSYLTPGKTCQNCPQKCLLCDENNPEQCLQCSQNGENRSLSIEINCDCLEGYFENELEICQQCLVPNCKKCDGTGICLECRNTDLIPPLCSISKIGIQINENSSNDSQLQVCNSKCLTCSESPEKCNQCSGGMNRLQESSECNCMKGYHDNLGTLRDCQPCPEECETCLDNEQCLECKNGINREMNYFIKSCECKSGYKETSNSKICEKCYMYNGKCLFECPQNTILNEEKGSCDNKEFQVTENLSLILILSVCFIVVTVLLKCIGYFMFQKIANGNNIQVNVEMKP